MKNRTGHLWGQVSQNFRLCGGVISEQGKEWLRREAAWDRIFCRLEQCTLDMESLGTPCHTHPCPQSAFLKCPVLSPAMVCLGLVCCLICAA